MPTTTKPMNIRDAIKRAETVLSAQSALDCDIQDARVDGEFLLMHLLNKSFTWLKTWPEHQLTEQQQTAYLNLLARRQKGEPIAYIVGEKSFWTLALDTNSSTLIPRADTEVLVETALSFLTAESLATAKILDLGTGTGAIALAIASERVNDQIIGCDFNQQAVELAKHNTIKNNISNVQIVQSDWFASIAQKNFDLIVSNPPYIEKNDPHLSQGDLVYEPSSALVSGNDGLDDIRVIINQSRNFLKSGACLMLEHGYQQASQVQMLLVENGYCEIRTIKDYAGLDRVTVGRFFN